MNTQHLRERMVEEQLRARGIRHEGVLDAMREVPRDEFVPKATAEWAYEDLPLPIGEGQTISQPYTVATMAEMLELKPTDKVLDVGTGSGYAAAVMSRIVRAVYSMERHEALAESAAQKLKSLGYDNVHVRHGDGTLGWPEHAPFDAIMVAAGGVSVPRPLLEQLTVGGRLVIPIGESDRGQKLQRIRRTSEEEYKSEDLGAVRFVPLIGEAGSPAGKSSGLLRFFKNRHQ